MSWHWNVPQEQNKGEQNGTHASALNRAPGHGVPFTIRPPPPQFGRPAPEFIYPVGAYHPQLNFGIPAAIQRPLPSLPFGPPTVGFHRASPQNVLAPQQYQYPQENPYGFAIAHQFNNFPHPQHMPHDMRRQTGEYGGESALHGPGPIRSNNNGYNKHRNSNQSQDQRAQANVILQHNAGSRHATMKNEPKVKADLELARLEMQKLGARLPGDSPEELERWISERRARWPSKENVERKLREEAARAERGEINSSRAPPTLREHVTGKMQTLARKKCLKRGGPPSLDQNAPKKGKVSAQTRTSSQPAGSSETLGDSNKDLTSGLCALASHYAGESSDGGPAETEDGQILESEPKGILAPAETNLPDIKGRDGSRRGQRKRKRSRAGNLNSQQTSVVKAKPTLLRKLLEPEIRAEQSIILQCIRVIVKDGFFLAEETSIPLSAQTSQVSDALNVAAATQSS